MADLQKGTIPQPPPPYYMQPRRSRWWIPIVTIAAFFGIILIFFVVVIAFFATSFESKPYTVNDNSVLFINIAGKLEERSNDSPLSFLNKQDNYTLSDVLKTIKMAKDDKRIKGIYIKAGMISMGFAKAEEIRDAIFDFKKSGKFVYAYMDWGSEIDYYIALTADKIFMPREGMIEMNGFAVTAMFYKGLLEKIGIDFYVLGFEDFKSAGEMYSRKNFSDSSRYQYHVLLNHRLNHFLDGVVKSRGLERQVVNDALNRGIYSTDSLLALGLIDSLLLEQDVKDLIRKEIYGNSKKNKKFPLVTVSNYIQDIPEIKGKKKIADSKKQIAIIYASGPIVEQIQQDFSNELKITSKEFISNLRRAREDDDVKVIIIRIDSPGGSVMASDAIYQEIKKTTKIKPVYASMSDVAASGGYYIAAPCDTIIAHPSTITGSIGVVLAIPNFSNLMKNIYVSIDTISSGPAATQFTGLIPMAEPLKEKIKVIARGVYDRFLNKVAENRKKTYDEVRALAKGRVWTGEEAYNHGLVDVLGGLNTAISLAKKRMGVPDSVKVYVQEYPEKKDPVETIMEMLGLGDKKDDEARIDVTSAMATYLGIARSDYASIYNSLPKEAQGQIKYMLTLIKMSEKEKVLFTMPEKIEIQ